jgi:hypothetical protein
MWFPDYKFNITRKTIHNLTQHLRQHLAYAQQISAKDAIDQRSKVELLHLLSLWPNIDL